ncbi:MATE family efflux transporter [Spirochaetia bacterium]|nr:MATE family efflux transporter [Spirochaetia bacterium]
MKRLGPVSFYREVLSIALPVMLQQLIMSMVSLIDNFMVAGLGDVSMAAVNVANQVNFINIVFVNAICGAGGIYLAQYRGANNVEGMRQAYRFKVIFSLAISILYFVLCWTIPGLMLGLMTHGNAVQGDILALGINYLKLTSFTLTPMAISMAIGSSYREIGLPKVPLYISAAATLVNTIGNWFLIYGNLGAPRLEVTGAAIATIIARVVEAAAFFIYAARQKTPFFTGFTKLFQIPRKLITNILSKSVMLFIGDFSWISSETIMMAIFNGRGGAEVVAGMAAGFSIANIYFLVIGGIVTATTVIIGGSLGAGKLDEARRRAGWLKSGSLVAGLVISLAGVGVSTLIIRIVFTNLTPAAQNIGLGMVFVILAYLPFWCLLNSLFAISRAGGDTAMCLYADATVNLLILTPCAFLLAVFTPLQPVAMFAIIKISDVVKYIIARHFLNKERWVRNLTMGN